MKLFRLLYLISTCFVLFAASLKIKADKERELRDSVCKQLVEGKRTIGTDGKNKLIVGVHCHFSTSAHTTLQSICIYGIETEVVRR